MTVRFTGPPFFGSATRFFSGRHLLFVLRVDLRPQLTANGKNVGEWKSPTHFALGPKR